MLYARKLIVGKFLQRRVTVLMNVLFLHVLSIFWIDSIFMSLSSFASGLPQNFIILGLLCIDSPCSCDDIPAENRSDVVG